MSEIPGRTTGFSRLINEKTMIQEIKPADQAINQLCPELPSDGEIEALSDAQPLIEKFVKGLVGKMKSNTFHMNFDDPLFLTDQHRVVWWPDSQRDDNIFDNHMDVLLGIRRAPGTKIDQSVGDGYAYVNIAQAPRFEDSQVQDMFEHVRSSNGKRMNPRAVCRVQHRIMQKTLNVLQNKYSDIMRVDELCSPDRQNSIILRVSLSSRFLDRQLQQEDGEDQRTKSSLSQRPDDLRKNSMVESERRRSSSRLSLVPSEVGDEDEKNLLRKKSGRMSLVPEEMLLDEGELRSFSIRFFTGMNYLSKDRIYFIARPYPYDSFTYKADVWRYFYRLRETQLLMPVFRADQFHRLRAMAGLVRMCAVDSELKWVSEDHLRQLLLHLMQHEIDSTFRWQRLSLLQVVREMLNGLRNCCTQKRLTHYFMDGLNVLASLDDGVRSRSIVRCSVLIKSDSALLRAVDHALNEAEKLTKDEQETQSNVDENGTVHEE